MCCCFSIVEMAILVAPVTVSCSDAEIIGKHGYSNAGRLLFASIHVHSVAKF